MMSMSWTRLLAVAGVVAMGGMAGTSVGAQAPGADSPQAAVDPVKVLVDRLDLAQYKATVKGLTKFGDRRQGTQRNRDAVDWIEAQL